MTLAAVIRPDFGILISDLDLMALFQPAPERLVLVGQRGAVAEVAIAALGRWVTVPRYFPTGKAVAFAAISAK